MRILVVGSGGVGSAFAPIAARRDFYEHIVFADHSEAKAEARRRPLRRRALLRRPRRCERRRGRRRAGPGQPMRRDLERGRPALRDARVRGRLRRGRHLHGHGDVALPTASGATSRGGRGQARGRAVRSGGAMGGTRAPRIARHGRRTGHVGRVRPTRLGRAVQRRSTRSASGTAPTWSSRATTSRRASRSGPRSRNASTRPSSGRRTAGGSRPSRSASRRSSRSPRGSVPSSA